MSSSDEVKLVSVSLNNTVKINGVEFKEGGHSVPSELAEDLVRIDKDYDKYQLGLNKNNQVSGNLGSVSAA